MRVGVGAGERAPACTDGGAGGGFGGGRGAADQESKLESEARRGVATSGGHEPAACGGTPVRGARDGT